MVKIDKLFAKSARLIAKAAKYPLPIATGMEEWFAYCDKVAPEHKVLWQRLRKLDFEMDAKSLTTWLTKLLRKESPPATINGFWFGLFNPYLDDDKPSSQMYVGGSTGFDPKSKSDEWACDCSWEPEGRYSISKVLDKIYKQVDPLYDDHMSYLGEAFLGHGYVALLLSQWCNGPMRETLICDAKIRAVVFGHDSGDIYRMAVLKAQ